MLKSTKVEIDLSRLRIPDDFHESRKYVKELNESNYHPIAAGYWNRLNKNVVK